MGCTKRAKSRAKFSKDHYRWKEDWFIYTPWIFFSVNYSLMQIGNQSITWQKQLIQACRHDQNDEQKFKQSIWMAQRADFEHDFEHGIVIAARQPVVSI